MSHVSGPCIPLSTPLYDTNVRESGLYQGGLNGYYPVIAQVSPICQKCKGFPTGIAWLTHKEEGEIEPGPG